MKIKLELDTEKTAKATVAIACTYGLARISKASKYPQLAAANALALIIIIAIFYGPRPAPKNPPNQPCVLTPSLSSSKRCSIVFLPSRGNQRTMTSSPSERPYYPF
jgi:hypothetical protein